MCCYFWRTVFPWNTLHKLLVPPTIRLVVVKQLYKSLQPVTNIVFWNPIEATFIKLIRNSYRSQWPGGLRPLAWWDYDFGSSSGHRCLSLVNAGCCQVEGDVAGWSLIQRSPTKCVLSEGDSEGSPVLITWSSRACCAMGEKRGIPVFMSQLEKNEDRTFKVILQLTAS